MPRNVIKGIRNIGYDATISNTNVVNCQPCQGFSMGCSANTGANDYSIEQHLASFAQVYPYNLLWSNWVIEKEAYKKRLANIAHCFPSYSSHGPDHSEVILSRIEALLGEARLRLLSPTDAWLLLQCAYSHDLGMCVSEQEIDKFPERLEKEPDIIKDLIHKNSFIEYLRDMDQDDYFSLFHVHDRLITSVRFLLRMLDTDDDQEIERFIKQLRAAEYSKAKAIFSTAATHYFRTRHAKRTREILVREAQESTLNGILPVRLRILVAEIDYCHGTLWSEILKRLPQQDNGLHTDYIHPQFVAALLRLGDLLDMDSNRFNPFQIELIDKLPNDSVVHYIKHMAITRFMVSPQWIDIEARYNTKDIEKFLAAHPSPNQDEAVDNDAKQPDDKEIGRIIEKSANALRDWISWLHDDLKEFAHNWNAIIPSEMPGYIAALRKNDIYIGNSDVPVEQDELELRYIISPQRASQIIIGSDLYNEPLTFIREIVQNSIDASKKQIFKCIREFFASSERDRGKGPIQQALSPYFYELLKRYSVYVDLEYKPISEPSKPSELKHDELQITFRDYGIGITYDKLKQMRQIGAIALSKEEKKNLEEMKRQYRWLCPTGEFGIGMQSVFAVADSFQITTFPRYEADRSPIPRRSEMGNSTGLQRSITMYCPELGGDIVNEEEIKDETQKNRFGTDVIVRLPLHHENLRKLLGYMDSNTFDRRDKKIQNIDVIMSRVEQYIRETFTDDIVTLHFRRMPEEKPFAHYQFPRFIEGTKTERPTMLVERCQEDPDRYIIRHWYISDDGMESALIAMEAAEQGRTRIYYRGILVNDNDNRDNLCRTFSIPGVTIRINIMCDSADKLLEINRDYFKPASYSRVKGIIQRALKSFYRVAFEYAQLSAEENAASVAALRDFFIRNPRHMMIFYEILRREKVGRVLECFLADFERFFLKSESHQAAIRQGGIQSLGIMEHNLYIDDISLWEVFYWAENDDIWYTDFSFNHALTPRLNLRQSGDRPLCAIEDNLSNMMDMYYRELRVFQDNTLPMESIMLYTLAPDDSNYNYTAFHEGEHALMCRLILRRYIGMYLSEENPVKRKEIGYSILAVPAIPEFESLAVVNLPPEVPAELFSHLKRFIVCPWTVETLFACCTDDSTPQKVNLDAESFLGLVDEEVFMEKIGRLAFLHPDMGEKTRKDEYKRFMEYLDVAHVD